MNEKTVNFEIESISISPPNSLLWHLGWWLIFSLLDLPLLAVVCSLRTIWVTAYVILPLLAISVSLERWFYSSRKHWLISSHGVSRDGKKFTPWNQVSIVEPRIGYKWGLEIVTDDGSNFHVSKLAKNYRLVAEILDRTGKLAKSGGEVSRKQIKDITLTAGMAFCLLAYLSFFNWSFHVNRDELLNRARAGGCHFSEDLIQSLSKLPI